MIGCGLPLNSLRPFGRLFFSNTSSVQLLCVNGVGIWTDGRTSYIVVVLILLLYGLAALDGDQKRERALSAG